MKPEDLFFWRRQGAIFLMRLFSVKNKSQVVNPIVSTFRKKLFFDSGNIKREQCTHG